MGAMDDAKIRRKHVGAHRAAVRRAATEDFAGLWDKHGRLEAAVGVVALLVALLQASLMHVIEPAPTDPRPPWHPWVAWGALLVYPVLAVGGLALLMLLLSRWRAPARYAHHLADQRDRARADLTRATKDRRAEVHVFSMHAKPSRYGGEQPRAGHLDVALRCSIVNRTPRHMEVSFEIEIPSGGAVATFMPMSKFFDRGACGNEIEWLNGGLSIPPFRVRNFMLEMTSIVVPEFQTMDGAALVVKDLMVDGEQATRVQTPGTAELPSFVEATVPSGSIA